MTVAENIQNRGRKVDVYNKQTNFTNKSNSSILLKRYLDLTLSGTRKHFASHGRGRKEHPLSPYTYDRPEIEKSVRAILQTPIEVKRSSKAPVWIEKINKHVVTHSGEAPLFSEKFLSAKKNEQEAEQTIHNRPLSGISTKSAPITYNGDMYYRPNGAHKYLQASSRPSSATADRLTRTYELRKKHRSQSMSAIPSDDTREELQRKKILKPRKQRINKDLLPIPCHANETPHSFIIGARYNCSHFMDSRSFSRLGLYVPRQNPIGSFVNLNKGIPEGADVSEFFVGNTSVQTGGSPGRLTGTYSPQKVGYKYSMQQKLPHHPNAALPETYVRKVVKEAWLKEESMRDKMYRQRKTQSANDALQDSKFSKQKPSLTPTRDYLVAEINRNANTEREVPKTAPLIQERSKEEDVKTPMQLFQQKIESEEMLNRLHIKTPLPTEEVKPDTSTAKQTIEAVLPPTS